MLSPTVNVSVSAASSIYILYLLVYRARAWAKSVLDEWGQERYSEEVWKEKKAVIMQRANILFWAEFIVGYPGRITATPALFSACSCT